MTENAPAALPKQDEEMWMVNFTLHYSPTALAPFWINSDVSYRPAGPEPQKWIIDGIASFDAPTLIPPRQGAELIPYLVFHLDEIKEWLTEEHVRRTFNGTVEIIRDAVTVASPTGRVHGV